MSCAFAMTATTSEESVCQIQDDRLDTTLSSIDTDTCKVKGDLETGGEGKEFRKPKKKKKRIRIKKIKDHWYGLVRILAYEGLNDEDLISKEESENRILALALVSGILLLIPATILTILICIEWSWKPIIVIPTVPELPEKRNFNAFPVQHVALINHDGSVYDISLNKNLSASKQLLLKLPEDKFYFGFDNGHGVLNFISATLSRKITQFYSAKHNVIPNSAPKMDHPSDYWSEGIQVGCMFWVWGRNWRRKHAMNFQFNIFNAIDTDTLIYYWKRNVWRKGPTLIPGASGQKATTAINATTIMMIFDVDDPDNHELVAPYLYSFARKQWTTYPRVKAIVDNTGLFAGHLSLTTLISKKSIKIFLHAVLLCWKLEGVRATKWLLSYDLKDGSNGEWLIEHQYSTCFLDDERGNQRHNYVRWLS